MRKVKLMNNENLQKQFLEDSPQGVLSGKRAGMKTCAILHTTPRSYFVDNFTPDSFLENLNALTKAWL